MDIKKYINLDVDTSVDRILGKKKILKQNQLVNPETLKWKKIEPGDEAEVEMDYNEKWPVTHIAFDNAGNTYCFRGDKKITAYFYLGDGERDLENYIWTGYKWKYSHWGRD